MIRSKEVVHKSWWCPPYYMSSCASPGSCGSHQLAAWDVERVAAGGCRRVRTWMRLRRRTCSSSSSSPSPATLTGPPGRHDPHHTLHGEPIKRESCGGGAITDFVAAVALGAELLDDRMSASPACMRPYHRHGAWCPVQRSLCIAGEASRAPATVGGVKYSAWYGALVEGHASSSARHLCLTPGLRWPPYLARWESARPP